MRTSGRVGRQGGTPMVDGAVERLTRWLRFDRGAYHSHVGACKSSLVAGAVTRVRILDRPL